jgi:caa(3)-type oxidase subunit IV
MAEQKPRRVTPLQNLLVYLALLALLVGGVLLARAELGALALPAALAVASVQGVLGLLFYMHLVEKKNVMRVVFPTSTCSMCSDVIR